MTSKPRSPGASSLVLVQALARSTSGDIDGALELLEGLRAAGYNADAEGFRFLLLLQRGRADDAVAVANHSLGQTEPPLTPLARSTWLLRRGLLHLEHERPLEALDDMKEVLKLRASPDHEDQARQALLRVAQQGRVQ